jgi:hypothetical protein
MRHASRGALRLILASCDTGWQGSERNEVGGGCWLLVESLEGTWKPHRVPCFQHPVSLSPSGGQPCLPVIFTQEMGEEGDGTRYLQQKTYKAKAGHLQNPTEHVTPFYNPHNLPANAHTYYTPLKLLFLTDTSGKPSTTSTNGP